MVAIHFIDAEKQEAIRMCSQAVRLWIGQTKLIRMEPFFMAHSDPVSLLRRISWEDDLLSFFRLEDFKVTLPRRVSEQHSLKFMRVENDGLVTRQHSKKNDNLSEHEWFRLKQFGTSLTAEEEAILESGLDNP